MKTSRLTFILACSCLSSLPATPLLAASTTPPNTQNAQPQSQPPGGASLSDAQSQELRLQLDKVSLLAETNKLDQAFALVDKLKKQYPDNPQVLLAEADLNLRIGNRGAGFAALSHASTLDPGNEDIMERQRSALLAQGPFVEGGYLFRQTKEANENIVRLDGQASINASMSAGLDIANDFMDTREPIRHVSGTVSDFSGSRQRVTATLTKLYDSGNEADGMLYGSDNNAGAGAQYTWHDHSGATALQGNLHRPDWNYVETVIEDGTRDNVRLERKQFINSNLQITLGGGFNQYNLDNDSDAARAMAWDLNVAYTHPYSFSGKPGDDVTLGAYYTVDAEYFTHVDERTIGGANYMPLPASSYEIHSVNLSASKDITSELHLEGYGGYAVDRLGDNGPLFGAVLEYAPVKQVGIELRAARTLLGGERSNEREDLLGLNVKWRL